MNITYHRHHGQGERLKRLKIEQNHPGSRANFPGPRNLPCHQLQHNASCIMSTPTAGTPQPTSSQQGQSSAATPQFVAYPLAAGQQPQLLPQASTSSEARTPPQTRLPSAETRKDRSLVDFLLMLDDYEPLVRCSFESYEALLPTYEKRFLTKSRIITFNVSALIVRTLACESHAASHTHTNMSQS
jgi:hypothetical protein